MNLKSKKICPVCKGKQTMPDPYKGQGYRKLCYFCDGKGWVEAPPNPDDAYSRGTIV